jgi:hypothetical protein
MLTGLQLSLSEYLYKMVYGKLIESCDVPPASPSVRISDVQPADEIIDLAKDISLVYAKRRSGL